MWSRHVTRAAGGEAARLAGDGESINGPSKTKYKRIIWIGENERELNTQFLIMIYIHLVTSKDAT